MLLFEIFENHMDCRARVKNACDLHYLHLGDPA